MTETPLSGLKDIAAGVGTLDRIVGFHEDEPTAHTGGGRTANICVGVYVGDLEFCRLDMIRAVSRVFIAAMKSAGVVGVFSAAAASSRLFDDTDNIGHFILQFSADAPSIDWLKSLPRS